MDEDYTTLPEEIHLEFLDRMDDTTLRNFCFSTKYNHRLCNNQAFWLRKIDIAGLTPLLPFRSFYNDSLPHLYFNIRNDACYMFNIINGVQIDLIEIYNDVNVALAKELKKFQEEYPNATSFADIEQHRIPGETTDYSIAVAIKGYDIPETMLISDYCIWSTIPGHVKYLNPQITSYPTLPTTEVVIVEYINGDPEVPGTATISVRDVTNAQLAVQRPYSGRRQTISLDVVNNSEFSTRFIRRGNGYYAEDVDQYYFIVPNKLAQYNFFFVPRYYGRTRKHIPIPGLFIDMDKGELHDVLVSRGYTAYTLDELVYFIARHVLLRKPLSRVSRD